MPDNDPDQEKKDSAQSPATRNDLPLEARLERIKKKFLNDLLAQTPISTVDLTPVRNLRTVDFKLVEHLEKPTFRYLVADYLHPAGTPTTEALEALRRKLGSSLSSGAPECRASSPVTNRQR